MGFVQLPQESNLYHFSGSIRNFCFQGPFICPFSFIISFLNVSIFFLPASGFYFGRGGECRIRTDDPLRARQVL